jgi:hypothetical protein
MIDPVVELYILDALKAIKRHNLREVENMFHGLSEADMQEEWGDSGRTKKQTRELYISEEIEMNKKALEWFNGTRK